MYQTYDSINGIRYYVGESKKLAYEFKRALEAKGLRAFVVKNK